VLDLVGEVVESLLGRAVAVGEWLLVISDQDLHVLEDVQQDARLDREVLPPRDGGVVGPEPGVIWVVAVEVLQGEVLRLGLGVDGELGPPQEGQGDLPELVHIARRMDVVQEEVHHPVVRLREPAGEVQDVRPGEGADAGRDQSVEKL
jgi:hypothetical protein